VSFFSGLRGISSRGNVLHPYVIEDSYVHIPTLRAYVDPGGFALSRTKARSIISGNFLKTEMSADANYNIAKT